MKKKLFALFLALAMSVSLTACSDEPEEPIESTPVESETSDQMKSAEPGSWAIYWYLCGSDLESGGGFASNDLAELMEVTLPENVNVVIETGGSSEWHNDFVDASKLQRYV